MKTVAMVYLAVGLIFLALWALDIRDDGLDLRELCADMTSYQYSVLSELPPSENSCR